jgi:hypothetical protein
VAREGTQLRTALARHAERCTAEVKEACMGVLADTLPGGSRAGVGVRSSSNVLNTELCFGCTVLWRLGVFTRLCGRRTAMQKFANRND